MLHGVTHEDIFQIAKEHKAKEKKNGEGVYQKNHNKQLHIYVGRGDVRRMQHVW